MFNDQKSFDKYVAKHALAKTDANRVGLNDKQVSGLNNARELIRWAYDADKGTSSPVLEVDNHFVVALLTGVHEDGYATVDEVAQEISFELRRQKKAELLAKKINVSGNSLAEIAANNGAQVASVPEANFGAYFLPGLGVEPKVIAAAVTAPQGKIVGPIQGTNAVYVLQSTSKTSNAAMMNVDAERQRISSMMAQRAAYELYQSMFELAKVKDLRGKYLF
jgi:peptidyl-prolyl cis-trans isomerase D